MRYDDVFYSKDADGTISKWYLNSWQGARFSVSSVRNSKLRDYKRYYHMNDIGVTIFKTRKEANASKPIMYPKGNFVSKDW